MRTGVALTFTAHNIELPDGSETLPGTELIARNGICRAALRDLELVRGYPPTVADLGCLEGGYAAAFARAGYRTFAYEARTENYLCCKYVAEQLAMPDLLQFFQADVREIMGVRVWDAVFCCGLLYHLDNPVAFLNQLGKSTRRLLILQTHYSTRPDAEHEGRRGHWYEEGNTRWSSWQNKRSFWLTKKDLMAAMRDVGFNLVFEQFDYLDDMTAEGEARGMFVGVKV
jgi:SAM-dependent methyltransferase